MNRDAHKVQIRAITQADSKEWERMRCELWPDGAADHAAEIACFFAGELSEPQAVLVATTLDGKVVGFVELSVRSHLEDLPDERVGYVEGLFVSSEARGQGVARELLYAAREWARSLECTAFASDRADRLIIDRKYWRKPG